MRTIHLPEAKTSTVKLTDDQANALIRVGNQLSGQTLWWGSSADDDQERSVFRLTKTFDGRWQVKVANVVGVVGLPGLTLVIEPKIGIEHFVYLLARAKERPRVSRSNAALESANDLQRLVVEWFLLELQLLIRAGLVRDYVEAEDALAFVRGHVDLTATSRRWLGGKLGVDCRFEDFTEDTPLNRTLAAAAEYAIMSPWVDEQLRRAIRQALTELPAPRPEPVRQWTNGDFGPRDRHYLPAIQYAMDILNGTGRRLATGDVTSGTFLINSAQVAEEGIRTVIAEALAPVPVVKTGGRHLLPERVAVRPDLEIGPPPFTGDVKYKLGDRSWNRQDLAQSVLFAAAYRSQHAVIADFVDDDLDARMLEVGDIRVSRVRWRIGTNQDPIDSESSLIRQLTSQLGGALSEWQLSAAPSPG